MEPQIIEVTAPEYKVHHVGVEIKDVNESGHFTGYGSTFGNIDEGNDICDEGCFDDTLKEHAKNDTMPAMFFSHDIKEPVGSWLSMEKNKKGLLMEGQLWVGQGIPKVAQTHMMLKSKSAKGLSIGFMTKKYSIDQTKNVRRLLKVDLLEVSPTPFPMNTRAKITGVKTLLLGKSTLTVREAEELLRDAGFPSAEAKHFLSCLKSGFNAERDAGNEILKALKSLTLN